MRYSEWAESFSIFSKYDAGGDVVFGPGPRMAWCGLDPERVRVRDLRKLRKLGWEPRPDGFQYHGAPSVVPAKGA